MMIKRFFLLWILLSTWTFQGYAQRQTFKYAFLSDTHIGATTGDEDLQRTVADLNLLDSIDFVIVTGDITEMGTKTEILRAKEILAGLKMPFYVMPGNHDTGWSESGGVDFINIFGYDKFTFDHKGYRFIGCASGPYVRMSDGHIPRDAAIWLKKLLAGTPKEMPVIFTNHYPLDNALDNWYETTDLLKTANIQYALCGHGHQNKAFDFEGIPATMGRSNLRAKDSIGGYNIVTMRRDSVIFAVKRPGIPIITPWRSIGLGTFKPVPANYTRPDFTINTKSPQVKEVWRYHASANVVVTPAVSRNAVVIGNSAGTIEALSLKDGRKLWSFQTQGGIFSSPAIAEGKVITGSGDGHIYALDLRTGKLLWKYATGASVLGSPVIDDQMVYIGGSDGRFRKLDVNTGKEAWQFDGVEGAIVGKPLLHAGKVIFGSWGRHLYALEQATGKLEWKWNNGSANRMFSPAMCTPVAVGSIVYIVAPDKVLTAIDIENGATLWRNREASVRESLGLSTVRSPMLLAKTMNDEVVAFKPGITDTGIAWKLNLGFGYEHVPSMLIEKDGAVFFGTKNGTVYAFDPQQRQALWAYKIDNAMVNTVNVISGSKLLAATMDGVVTLISVSR